MAQQDRSTHDAKGKKTGSVSFGGKDAPTPNPASQVVNNESIDSSDGIAGLDKRVKQYESSTKDWWEGKSCAECGHPLNGNSSEIHGGLCENCLEDFWCLEYCSVCQGYHDNEGEKCEGHIDDQEQAELRGTSKFSLRKL